MNGRWGRATLTIGLFICLFLSGFSPGIAVASEETQLPPDLMDLQTRQGTGINVEISYPIYHYSWDAGDFFQQFDPFYVLGNFGMIVAVTMLYFAIWFLNLGYAPSGWLSPLKNIAESIQNTVFTQRVFPFVGVVAGFVLAVDFFKGDYRQMLKRAVTFGVVALMVILYRLLGSEAVLETATDAVNKLSYATTAWVMNSDQQPGNTVNPETIIQTGDTSFEKMNGDVYNQIWDNLITAPWEVGQIGKVGLRVRDVSDEASFKEALQAVIVDLGNGSYSAGLSAASKMSPTALQTLVSERLSQSSTTSGRVTEVMNEFKEHANDLGWWASVKNWWNGSSAPAVDTSWIQPDTRLSTIFLMYPTESEPRKAFVEIVKNNYKEANVGFNPIGRFITGVITLICVLASCVYFFVIGAYLLFLHLAFLGGIFLGSFILPVSLLPWNYSPQLLRWWGKFTLGSVVLKVGLSAFVGLTFYSIKIFSPEQTSASWGNIILTLCLYPLIFTAALWILGRFQRFNRPFESLGSSATQMFSPDFDTYGMSRRAGNGFRWYYPNGDSGAPAFGGGIPPGAMGPEGGNVGSTARPVDPENFRRNTDIGSAGAANPETVGRRGGAAPGAAPGPDPDRTTAPTVPNFLSRAIHRTVDKSRRMRGENLASIGADFLTNVGQEAARSVFWKGREAVQNFRDRQAQRNVPRTIEMENSGKTVRVTSTSATFDRLRERKSQGKDITLRNGFNRNSYDARFRRNINHVTPDEEMPVGGNGGAPALTAPAITDGTPLLEHRRVDPEGSVSEPAKRAFRRPKSSIDISSADPSENETPLAQWMEKEMSDWDAQVAAAREERLRPIQDLEGNVHDFAELSGRVGEYISEKARSGVWFDADIQEQFGIGQEEVQRVKRELSVLSEDDIQSLLSPEAASSQSGNHSDAVDRGQAQNENTAAPRSPEQQLSSRVNEYINQTATAGGRWYDADIQEQFGIDQEQVQRIKNELSVLSHNDIEALSSPDASDRSGPQSETAQREPAQAIAKDRAGGNESSIPSRPAEPDARERGAERQPASEANMPEPQRNTHGSEGQQHQPVSPPPLSTIEDGPKAARDSSRPINAPEEQGENSPAPNGIRENPLQKEQTARPVPSGEAVPRSSAPEIQTVEATAWRQARRNPNPRRDGGARNPRRER